MLSIVALHISYGELQVLHDVSIQIDEGKIVSLVGANASGKSTLINTISGLNRPNSGKILFGEIELSRLPGHEIVKRGVVQIPEGRKLFPQMTTYENLMVGGSNPRARENRKKTLEQIYEIFPLLRVKAKQLAGTLSGGEQQAVAIARGLMSMPKLLMLDEPSLGMAPLLVRETFRNIKVLNDKGLTIFLVEQNIKQSLSLCNYGYVLQNGRIVLQGTGSDILENELTKKAYLGA
jgi:branched-chain amino acid transport system ATP-binding protein